MTDYRDENIWLMQGDCLDRLKETPDSSVDLALTDPPYKMTKRGKSCRPNWMKSNMGDNVFDYPLPETKAWFSEMYRVLKEGTHCYVFTNTVSLQEYLNAATEVGFTLHNVISMIKDTGMPNRWYLKRTELVLFFRKGSAVPINDLTSRDYIHVEMPTEKTGKYHITQKPLDFIEKLVTNSSERGDTVLDIFMGSGTTGVACAQTGRKFIGIELDSSCYEISKGRILGATGKEPLVASPLGILEGFLGVQD